MRDESSTPLPELSPRKPESHKGDYGRAMIVGGSRGMSGAIAMAGMACQRTGAGLTTLGVPACIGSVVASFHPAYMIHELVDDDSGVLYWANLFDLVPIQNDFNAWAIGPGLGDPELTSQLAGRMHREWSAPLVIDADGLNGVALYEDQYGAAKDGPPAARVLTPHPGEFAHLIGDQHLAEQARGDDQARVEAAATLAQRDPSGQTVVVLKGHRTVIADAERYAINTTGNPGMATGGSGDVLTGILTALLAQGLSPYDASRLATHAHGKAGDLAAAELGQTSLIATDLIDCLPAVFQELSTEA